VGKNYARDSVGEGRRGEGVEKQNYEKSRKRCCARGTGKKRRIPSPQNEVKRYWEGERGNKEEHRWGVA